MRSWVAAAVAVLALSACGIQPTGDIDAGPGSRATWEATTIYFLTDDGRAHPTFRDHVRAADQEELAAVLAAGPTEQEREAGLRTEVPDSLRLSVDAGRLVVDAAGSLPEPALVQIACTLQRNGLAGPAATTLHAPDGTVVHDRGCPVN